MIAMTRLAGLAIAVLGVVALACADSGATNQAEFPSTETPGPVTEIMPLATTFAIVARAEALCPDKIPDVFLSCGKAYADAARSGMVAVRCVNASEGLFYFTTPGATPPPTQTGREPEGREVGDNCAEAGYEVVAVVSG